MNARRASTLFAAIGLGLSSCAVSTPQASDPAEAPAHRPPPLPETLALRDVLAALLLPPSHPLRLPLLAQAYATAPNAYLGTQVVREQMRTQVSPPQVLLGAKKLHLTYPHHPYVALLLAEAHLYSQQPDAAAQVLAQLTTAPHPPPESWRLMCAMRRARTEWDELSHCGRQLAKLPLSRPDGIRDAVSGWWQRGEWAQAENYLTSQLATPEGYLYGYLALVSAAQNHTATAQGHLQRYLSEALQTQDRQRAAQNLAALYQGIAAQAPATRACNIWAKLFSGDRETDRLAAFALSIILLSHGAASDLTRALHALLDRYPDHQNTGWLWYLIGTAQAETGANPEAREAFARVPQESSLYVESVFALSRLWVADNAPHRARELVSRATTHPEARAAMFVLASDVLTHIGDPSSGLETLEHGLRRYRQHPDLLYRRGTLLLQIGRTSDALAAMQQLLVHHPGHGEALNFIAYTLAENGSDLERAEQLAREALATEPHNPYYLDTLGWILLQRGSLDAAQQALEHALVLLGNNATLMAHYAELLFVLGKPEQALQLFDQALAATHDDAERRRIEEQRRARFPDPAPTVAP